MIKEVRGIILICIQKVPLAKGILQIVYSDQSHVKVILETDFHI